MSSVKALDRYSCALWRASAEGLYSEALTKAVCADLCALHSCDCLIHNNFGSTKVATTAPLGVTPTLTGEDNGFSLETTVKAFTLNAEAKEFVPGTVFSYSSWNSAPCDPERLSRRSAIMASIKARKQAYEEGRTPEQIQCKALLRSMDPSLSGIEKRKALQAVVDTLSDRSYMRIVAAACNWRRLRFLISERCHLPQLGYRSSAYWTQKSTRPAVLMVKKKKHVSRASSLPQPNKPHGQTTVISLCDGIGGAAMSLKKAGHNQVTRYISVEIAPLARKIADHASPPSDDFPGIDRSFGHDVLDIQESHISSLPTGSVKAVFLAAPCGDFCKLRMLPDREGYTGPANTVPGSDPRKGLKGKGGKVFLKGLQVIGWCIKHHPGCKYLVENVDFSDMTDWGVVCEQLGQPLVVDAAAISYTHRVRSYWTNIPVILPLAGKPLNADDCFEDERKACRYTAHGKMHVRPLGASYSLGTDTAPISSSRRKLQSLDADGNIHEITPSQAEALMGLPKDSTKANGVSNRERLNSIGLGWDINVIAAILFRFVPSNQSLDDRVSNLVATWPENLNPDFAAWQSQLVKANETDETAMVTFLESQEPEDQVEVLALLQHYKVFSVHRIQGSIVDSGSARHISSHVNITDSEDKLCLTGFEGSTSWTMGSGYMSLVMKDKMSDKNFSLTITKADRSKDSIASILSMGKLINSGWSFLLSQSEMIAHTPCGKTVSLEKGDDDIIMLPHQVPKEHTDPQHDYRVHLLRRVISKVPPEFLHKIFNHASPKRIHDTLGVTIGWKQPSTMLPGVPCTACSAANLRRKGLSHQKVNHVCDASNDFNEDTCVSASVSSCSDSDTEYIAVDSDDSEDIEDLSWAATCRYISAVASADTTWDSNNYYAPLRTDAVMPVADADLSDGESDGTSSEAESDEDDALREALRYKAPTAGRESIQAVPRYVATTLRKWELMFADWKDYDETQRGGYTCYLIVYCASSGAKFKYDARSHTASGRCFRAHAAKHGVHLMPYSCTIYTDNCGSMNHLKDAAIEMGINHCFTPPHEQSLNEAEKVVDQVESVARVLMTSTGAPSTLRSFAISYVMYVDLRMASAASKGGLTPYESIVGQKPRVDHMRPWFCKTYVTASPNRRKALRAQGQMNVRAEPGRFLGYADAYGSVAKVLLSDNRVVASINVIHDPDDCSVDDEDPASGEGEGVTNTETLDFIPLAAFNDDEETELALTPLERSQAEGLYSEKLLSSTPDEPLPPSPGRTDNPLSSTLLPPSPQPSLQLLTPSDPEMESLRSQIEPESNSRPTRDSTAPNYYQPGDTGMGTSKLLSVTQRGTLIETIDGLEQFDADPRLHGEAITTAIKDAAFIGNVKVDDPSLHIQIAANMALHATKDMSWAKALSGPDREKAIQANSDEFTSLQKNILTEVSKDHPEWTLIKAKATPGRMLLDLKRSGKHKARAVKQGFKEDKASADGPDYNYYSHVAKLQTVRLSLLRPRRKNRRLAVKDVSTAFLQSDRYPEGVVKYMCIKDPVSLTWRYFEQSGPIYGEASAPIRWELTIAPWLVEQGFTRGQNEKCVFYHKERDLLVVLYVDDLLADGSLEDVDWIFDLLDIRFQCKPADYLTTATPLDYLGMEVSMTSDALYICMAGYIDNCIDILGLKSTPGARHYHTPIADAIDVDSAPLTPGARHYFLKCLGMAGWLANTVRLDISYAVSRISQHAATPNESALCAVKRVFYYLDNTRQLGLSVLLHQDRNAPEVLRLSQQTDGDVEGTNGLWEFWVDSDYAGNSESQNKRRAQNGSVFTIDRTPVTWSCKVTSVCFAHADIGESHADMSSAAAEVYSAGNAAMDLMHLSYVVDEMGMDFPKPVFLQMDNDAAKVFANDTAFKTTLRHIDVRQHWVQVLRNKSILIPVWIAGLLNLADFFTKILARANYEPSRDQMMTEVPKTDSPSAT